MNSHLRWPLVFSLCLQDLKHEKMLSFCMIMAVASVLGPLLILFGLKFGTVETLRNRLLLDPRNCEVRPMSVQSFNQEWFTQTKQNPHVAFVVPYTRQLATGVELFSGNDKAKGVSADLIPTDDNDPLILQNGGSIPELTQCLLTTPAAEALGAKAGDLVTLSARRMVSGKLENGEIQVEVLGVMPIRAGAVKGVFVRLPVLEAVESFKDGMAVPMFNWPGTLPRAFPAFSSMLVVTPSALDPETEFKLTHNTGFTSRTPVTPDEVAALAGIPVQQGCSGYVLSGKGALADATNIKAVRYLLRGKQALLYPLALEKQVTLQANKTELGTFSLLPATEFAASAPAGLPARFPWEDDFSNTTAAAEQWRVVLAPKEVVNAYQNAQVLLSIATEDGHLTFPVHLQASDMVPSQTLKLPLHLLGVLSLAQTRPITYDANSDSFLLHKRGYAGFRMYAANLEQVSFLKKQLEDTGLTVHTEAERIDDVLRLDTYLTLIFWLIALGSLVGGAACLLANIYAGIERKKRELAVLRLLGLSGGAFLRFPLYTAAVFSVSGFGAALVLFYSIAGLINSLFSAHLQEGESLCRLAWWHPFAALALTLGITLIAGLIAANRSATIDPADALRNE